MPTGIIRPSNQIKQTNLAVVWVPDGKKRFEIACYKNKVQDYRKGVDKDLDNVLQTRYIYRDSSQGLVASRADVKKAFPKLKNEEKILEHILETGVLQVGELEREAELERIQNEVINFVASNVVHPETLRVYTPGMIEKALEKLSIESAKQPTGKNKKKDEKEIPRWTGVVANKGAKPQGLAAIKALVAHQPFPVMRARMRLRLVFPTAVKDSIVSHVEKIEKEDATGEDCDAVAVIDPAEYNAIRQIIESKSQGRGRLEVLDQAIKNEGD